MSMEGLRRSEKKALCRGLWAMRPIWTLAQSDLSYAAWVKMKREGGRKASLQSYFQRLGFVFLFSVMFLF